MFLWESDSTVETVCLLSNRKPAPSQVQEVPGILWRIPLSRSDPSRRSAAVQWDMDRRSWERRPQMGRRGVGIYLMKKQTMKGITIRQQERRSGGLTGRNAGTEVAKCDLWSARSAICRGSQWYWNRYCALSALMVVYGQEQPCCRVADLYST